MTATAWALNVYDLAGGTVLTPMPFRSLKATWQLNAPGTIEFDVVYRGGNPQATYGSEASPAGHLRPGARILKLTRNGTVVWGGYLMDLQVEAKARRITAQGDGWWARVRQRVIDADLIWTAATPLPAGANAQAGQHAIAWAVLNHIQGQADGGLGFTDGANNGTDTFRSRHYCGATERPNAAQAVEDFTALDDGFDFEIDPATRALNTWGPQRKSTPGITLNESNLMDLQWQDSVRDTANVISAQGTDDCGPVLDDFADSSLRAAYGRLQDIVQSNSDTQSEIDAEGREELRARKHSTFTARAAFEETAGPAWGTYSLGDLITLAPSRYFTSFSRTVRIVSISLSLESGGLSGAGTGRCFYELDLTSAID